MQIDTKKSQDSNYQTQSMEKQKKSIEKSHSKERSPSILDESLSNLKVIMKKCYELQKDTIKRESPGKEEKTPKKRGFKRSISTLGEYF